MFEQQLESAAQAEPLPVVSDAEHAAPRAEAAPRAPTARSALKEAKERSWRWVFFTAPECYGAARANLPCATSH
jgi:hypothetical protein